jgi:hypothetical protein
MKKILDNADDVIHRALTSGIQTRSKGGITMKTSVLIVCLLFATGFVSAQTPASAMTVECRILSGDNFVGPNETIIKTGDNTYQACHPVETKAVSASASPAPAPTVSAPQQEPPPVVQPQPQPQQPPSPDDGKIRVYVTDRPVSEVISIIHSGSYAHAEGDRNGFTASAGSATGGISNDQKGAADHRTLEISDDIIKDCHNPGLVLTNNPANAKYILDFRRQGGRRSTMFAFGGLTGLALSSAMKVDGAALYLQNGDMVKVAKGRSVEGTVKELCGSIR